MKKMLALTLASVLAVSMLAGCGSSSSSADSSSASSDSSSAAVAEEGQTVYNVCNLVNGTLGDKSFFDSAEAGLAQLAADGRITYTTIEMGGTTEDEPKWESYLEEVSASGEYDVIVVGTYQMPDQLKNVSEMYPDQKYVIYDDTSYQLPNVANLYFAQNDMGYLVGTYAAAMTSETSIEGINEDAVIGFVGGVDSPVINDFLYGFILGAQAVNPDIKIDTRYTNDYVDPAKGKELAESMINDNNCDIVWGVAGNAGNGAAEAALETGKAYFIGVDSDQESTFSAELAAITLTSGLKNIGSGLIWFFDQMDADAAPFGEHTLLGIAEDGVGIVTDKNYATVTPDSVKELVDAALAGVSDGSIDVPTAIGDTTDGVVALRESVKP